MHPLYQQGSYHTTSKPYENHLSMLNFSIGCIRPGSNRRPYASEAYVITTTLRKQNFFIPWTNQIKSLSYSPVDERDLPEEPGHDGLVVEPGVGRREVKAEADAERADHDEEAAPVLATQRHT